MSDDFTFPAGNAQVGDLAWWRPVKDDLWQIGWNVVEVGVEHPETGRHHAVRIRNEEGEERVVSAFPYRFEQGQAGQSLLFPRAYPAAVEQVTQQYGHLAFYRDGGNGSRVRLKPVCMRCWSDLQLIETQTSAGELVFYEGDEQLSQRKPEVCNTEVDIRCRCPLGESGDGNAYKIRCTTYEGYEAFEDDDEAV